MLLVDVTTSSHTRAQTGIQRVCRSLYLALAEQEEAVPICYDPHERTWRQLDRRERVEWTSHRGLGGASRSAKWSLTSRLAGHARRLTGRSRPLPQAHDLICPEVFSARTAAQLPALRAEVTGPRVALFHDALPLKFPELTPPGTVARFPSYLDELRQFDGIAAVSEDSAASLRDYWTWLDLGDAPPVQAIPLGIDPLPEGGSTSVPAGPARVLCVATLEGRKNHLALLEAAERLWADGLPFELELIGLARPETAGVVLARLRGLQAAGRPVHYHGSVSDEALHQAYQRCTFTVYPSLMEGFGLPVLESVQHGRPCICSAAGALGESARGGGCLTVGTPDAPSLAAATRELLTEPGRREALAVEARSRKFRTWRDHAADLRTWMATVPRRA